MFALKRFQVVRLRLEGNKLLFTKRNNKPTIFVIPFLLPPISSFLTELSTHKATCDHRFW